MKINAILDWSVNDQEKKPGNPSPYHPEAPAKPDQNPDPARSKPGGNDREMNDPAKIQEPYQPGTSRIEDPPVPGR